VVFAITLSLAGCNSGGSNKANSPPTGESASSSKQNTGHAHSAADEEKAKAVLAKLSPEDAASAQKQHVCLVAGELLGSMGPPKKVDVNGQQVWICCEGCRDKLLANPEKYLAKAPQE
jgi:Cu(I)/Ag(I) efflux system membrane fusion protein